MKTSRSLVGFVLVLVLAACRGSTPSLQVEAAESALAPESSTPTPEPADAVDATLTATPDSQAPARRPCNLAVAPWELALARARYARDAIAWHPEAGPVAWDPGKPRDAAEQAALAVAALPPSDPRFAEAHCRMALMNQHAAAETHFLLAIAALRASAPEGPARYRSLERPATHIATTQGPTSPGRQTRIDLQIMGNGFEAEDCRFPDLALLEIGQADVYSAAGRRAPGEPPRRERKPKGVSLLRAGTNHIVALLQEVQAALGPEHAYVASLREQLMTECDDAEQARFPRICRPETEVRRELLRVWKRELGDDHALTRHGKLLVAHDLLGRTGLAKAKRLLLEVADGVHDEAWVLASQVLAGISLHEGDAAGAYSRMRLVVAEVPRILAGDPWDHGQVLRNYADVATAAGEVEVAADALEQAELLFEGASGLGPWGGSLALAQAHEDAGDLEGRDRVLESRIAEHEIALKSMRTMFADERAWRIEEIAVARACLGGAR